MTDLPPLDRGLSAFVADKRLLLCDVWGVLHNGERFHGAAVEALCRFRDSGGAVVLVTNAPVPEWRVRRRLDQLGVDRHAYDRVVTAGDVTVELLAAAGCPPVHTIGPPGEASIFKEIARRGVTPPARVGIEEAALVVCLGLVAVDDHPGDYDDVLARARARGLDLICANPDIVVEVGDGLIYCAGAIAARYEALGGTVIQTGKPYPAIYARALALGEGLLGPVLKSQVLAIGDAVATDLAGATQLGVAALFITGGIHRGELHPADTVAPDLPALRRLLGDAGPVPEAALFQLAWDAPR